MLTPVHFFGFKHCSSCHPNMYNVSRKPGVGRAVLILIELSFSFKYSKHHNSKTVRPKELKKKEEMFMSHVSHVTCPMSSVTFFCGQSGRASLGRVCYQHGLPRLVYLISDLFRQKCFKILIHSKLQRIFKSHNCFTAILPLLPSK